MCGPLAAASCQVRSNKDNGIQNDIIYHATRLAAYGLFGGLLGYLGVGLLQGAFRLYSSIVSMGLSVVFGLVGISVFASAWTIDSESKSSGPRDVWSSMAALKILKVVSWPSQFVLSRFQGSLVDRALPRPASAGLLSAMLPCGLLYSALLQSVLSPGPGHAGLGMVVFGLGTVPGLWISKWFFAKAKEKISLKKVRLAMAFVLLSVAAVLFVKSWNAYLEQCGADSAQQSS
jgi:sulfite exporter TauE/SafE